jgi:hypothetical protein
MSDVEQEEGKTVSDEEVEPSESLPEGTPDEVEDKGLPIGLRVAFGLILGFLSLGLIFVIAEVAVRVIKPDPRVQIVRDLGGIHLEVIDGVPVWEEHRGNVIVNEGCVERVRATGVEPLKVAVFGSSILYGSGVDFNQNFSHLLQKRLDEDRKTHQDAGQKVPPTCIRNFSQPAFGHANKYALATRRLQEFKPDLIYWEIWKNELNKHVMVGDVIYSVKKLTVGEDGLPMLFSMPQGLNRWLLENSRFYEYATLALSQSDASEQWTIEWRRFAHNQLSQVVSLADTLGARLELVFCPSLDQPFSETLANWDSGYLEVENFAKERDIVSHRLSRALLKEDFMAVRNDPCCHYNVEGHRKIAEHVYGWTLKALPELARPVEATPSEPIPTPPL